MLAHCFVRNSEIFCNFRREIFIMVKNCVAANCSNTHGHGVSLFKFPKDPALHQKWIKNVQKTRANWSGPSEHSVLCSQHFESSCFEVDSELAAQKRRLKPDAVPTLIDLRYSCLRLSLNLVQADLKRGPLQAVHHLLIQLLTRLEQLMRREI